MVETMVSGRFSHNFVVENRGFRWIFFPKKPLQLVGLWNRRFGGAGAERGASNTGEYDEGHQILVNMMSFCHWLVDW